MLRIVAIVLSLLAFVWSASAAAEVRMSFHSFSGSIFSNRYPHAFVVLEGTLGNGQRVSENFGFTAAVTSRDILRGPVKHAIQVEPQRYIDSTKRHFTVTLSDAEYRRVRAEVERWRNAPGNQYDLDRRNCIHFVGAMAQIAGLRVTYPQNMIRRPARWLNHVTALNPQLSARGAG